MIDFNIGWISWDHGELKNLVPRVEEIVKWLFALKKADSFRTRAWNFAHMSSFGTVLHIMPRKNSQLEHRDELAIVSHTPRGQSYL